MTKVKDFIKNEIVLIISFILAVISSFFVTPNIGYFEYIDFRTLGLLFCLMVVMAGLNRLGIFKFAAEKMLSKIKSIAFLFLAMFFLGCITQLSLFRILVCVCNLLA